MRQYPVTANSARAQRPDSPHQSGRPLFRGIVASLLGQGLAPAAGILALPFVIHGVGPSSFGVIAILLSVVGYTGVLELGLARSLVKHVSRDIALGNADGVAATLWSVVVAQACLGILTMLLLLLLTPALIGVLRIPVHLQAEADRALHVVAVLPPLMFVTGTFFGLLAAGLRFTTLSVLQAASSVLTYASMAVAASVFHVPLPGIVVLLAAVDVLTLLAAVTACLVLFPAIRRQPSFTVSRLRELSTFGSWVAAHGLLGQFATYFDRVLIGHILVVSAVTYYAVPFDALSKLWIVPSSVVTVLFPAFSGMVADRNLAPHQLSELYIRALKGVLIVLLPVIFAVEVFSGDLLRLWMGVSFAGHATSCMRVLAVAVPLASVAWLPFTLVQSAGRPDLEPKFLLLELAVYAAIAWPLIHANGILGAAVASALRGALDLGLNSWAVHHLGLVPGRTLLRAEFAWTALLIASLTVVVIVLTASGLPLLPRSVLATAVLAAFALLAWIRILDARDRSPLLALVFFHG